MSRMPPSRLVVVHESRLERRVLADAVRRASLDSSAVSEAEDLASAAIEARRGGGSALVFLDLDASTGSLDTLSALVELVPAARPVLVTHLPDADSRVQEGLRRGAFAYVQKPVRDEAIRQILEAVEV